MIEEFYECENEGCRGFLLPIGVNNARQTVFQCNLCTRMMKTDCASCMNGNKRGELHGKVYDDVNCILCKNMGNNRDAPQDNFEYDRVYNTDMYPHLFLVKSGKEIKLHPCDFCFSNQKDEVDHKRKCDLDMKKECLPKFRLHYCNLPEEKCSYKYEKGECMGMKICPHVAEYYHWG